MKKIIKIKKNKKPKTKKTVSSDKKSINVNVHIDQSKKHNRSSSVKHISKGTPSSGAPSILFQPPTPSPVFQQQPQYTLADIVNTIRKTVTDLKNEESSYDGGTLSKSVPLMDNTSHLARIDAIKQRHEAEKLAREQANQQLYGMKQPSQNTESTLPSAQQDQLFSGQQLLSPIKQINMEDPNMTINSTFNTTPKSQSEAKDEDQEEELEVDPNTESGYALKGYGQSSGENDSSYDVNSISPNDIDQMSSRELKRLAKALELTYSVQGVKLSKDELQKKIKKHLGFQT
jgi:hypothetical protein